MSDFRLQPGPLGLPLGFGTWAIGEEGWGPMHASDAKRLLSAAWDAGFRHFDSAEAYGNGRAEQLVGQALRSQLRRYRDEVQLATKTVVRPPQSIRRHLERSLRRLGVDHIDVYYIHWPRPGISLAAAVEELERLRADGLLSRIGLCNVTPTEVQEAARSGTIDIVQFGYNMIWRAPERAGLTLLPHFRLAYSPLAQGLLARIFPVDPVWTPEDHRAGTPLFQPGVWHAVHAFNQLVVTRCENDGIPPAAIALSWVFAHADGAVVGGRTREQVAALVEGLQTAQREESACRTILSELEAPSLELQQNLPNLANFFGYEPTPCRGC